jgi:2'-5' RNA ligase
MPDGAFESAIVVRVSVPPAIERLRRRRDRAARMGVPAHVTILYPFMPPDDLASSIRSRLAGIGAEHEPFDVRFGRVGRFPTAVYAAPDDPAPFLALIDAVVAAFPGYLPYGGVFDEVIPHLTLVESTDVDLEAISEAVGRHLPFTRRVATLEVLVEGPDGRWHPRWRLPLGRPSRSG